MKKILLLALVFVPFIVGAQEFIPLTNLPGIEEAASSDTLPAFFNNLYKLCIGAAAVIAILQIMRAGTYFMFNKGSVAHNEKGKSLIMNAILGLLLVLSPAIVFGIINPDILDLKLDLSGIQTQPIASTTADRVRYSSCSSQYEPIVAVSGTTQCDTTMGFERLPASCGTPPEGAIYCGKPKTSAQPSEQTISYMWRIAFEKCDAQGNCGLERRWEQAGPFANAQACTASLSSKTESLGTDGFVVSGELAPQCNCSKPKHEWPSCRNL